MARRSHNSYRSGNNLVLVYIFAVCVLFLIGVSLIIKFIAVWNMSTFDGSHRFTVLVSDPQNKTVLLTVDPSLGEHGKIIVKDASSVDDVLSDVPVAVDGIIVLSTKLTTTDSLSTLIQTALIKRNELRHQLTFIDLVRMYIATRTTTKHELSGEDVSFPLSDADYDLLSQFFVDGAIEDENLTIAIENATAISGVGGRLEEVLTSMGAEVISVETAVRQSDVSRIMYYEEDTYTVNKLQTLFGYETEKSDRIGISDISIIIGEDGLENIVLGSFGIK